MNCVGAELGYVVNHLSRGRVGKSGVRFSREADVTTASKRQRRGLGGRLAVFVLLLAAADIM